MAQPPVAEFHEDREMRLRHRRSGWLPCLVAVPVVVAVAAVAILGALGPKTGPSRTNQPTPSGTAALGKVSPSPQAMWTPPPGPSPTSNIAGLANRSVDQSKVTSHNIGAGVLPMDADGDTFVYLSGPDLFLTNTIKSVDPIQLSPSAPCTQVVQAAISGVDVIYSRIDVNPEDSAGGCDAGTTLHWEVDIVDWSTLKTRLVASGSCVDGEAGPVSEAPRVAISENAYAFSRTGSDGGSSAVEVHSLADDGRFFSSGTLSLPMQINVTNNRLIVVAPAADSQDLAILSTDNWSTQLAVVGVTTGPVSLSRDGTRLAYENCSQDTCAPTLWIDGVDLTPMQLPSEASWISVDSITSSTLQSVAWLPILGADDQSPYIGLICAGRSPMALTGITGIVNTGWVHVQDDILMWLSNAPDGNATLYSLDLASTVTDW